MSSLFKYFSKYCKLIVSHSVTCLLALLCLLASQEAVAQDTLITLWPAGKIPNSKGLAIEDSISNYRIYQIKSPRMLAFFPTPDDNSGTAVLIFPGGGYSHLTLGLGAIRVAKWFNTMGISAFVVLYRLPTSPDLIKREIGPLQDAQRAMRIVRANASKWHIKPNYIGVFGASAGGHVASTLGTHLNWDVSSIGDSLDGYSFKPNFMVLVSPVITMGKYAHKGSRRNLLGPNPPETLIKKFSNELHVSDQTPPTFMINAFNDPTVDPHNELMFYRALLAHNVSTSFHTFPKGGHSLQLNMIGSAGLWPELCKEWLREKKLL